MTIKTIYIVDTDSLAKLGKLHENIFVPIWGGVESIIIEGRLITHYKVMKEIEKKYDKIYNWLNEMEKRYSIAYPISPFQVKKIGEIHQTYMHFVDSESEKENADPYLITQALELIENKQKTIADQENEYYIVTEERVGTERKNYDNPEEVTRIPDFCHVFGIKHTNFWGMMEKEGWKWTK